MIQAQQPKLLLDNIMVRFLTDIAYRNVGYKYPTYTLIYTIKEQINKNANKNDILRNFLYFPKTKFLTS